MIQKRDKKQRCSSLPLLRAMFLGTSLCPGFVLCSNLVAAQEITSDPAASNAPAADSSSSGSPVTEPGEAAPRSDAGIADGTSAQTILLNNYEGANIRDFIRSISMQTGFSFVLDPRITDNLVTIIAPPDTQLTLDEVWELFLATMQINDYAVLPITEGEYRIVPTSLAPRQQGELSQTVADGEIVTRIIRLKTVDARTAATSLRDMAGTDAIVTPVTETNSLVIVDTASNVARLSEVLSRIDRDNSVVKLVSLENAVAADIAAALSEINNLNGDRVRLPTSLSVISIDSNNAIAIRGQAAEVERFAELAHEMDRESLSQVDLSVIKLKHADASEIVPILTEMIDKSFGTSTDVARPSVVFHEQTNALIINADSETQRIINSVVQQLDVRRPQVLIEAIIVNVSDNTARDLGLQYVVAGQNQPVITQSFTNNQPNLLAGVGAAFILNNREENTVVDADNNTTTTTNDLIPGTDAIIDTAIQSLLGARGFNIGGGDVSGDGTLFGAILSAIESDTDSNVLSTPFTVTLDNEPARLQVGQEIPITTGEQVGTQFQNTFRTVERQEVGIILEVTPQITEGSTVKLQITQEVSSINGALTAGNTDFVTNKAIVTTTAQADSGEVLILGGLIDDNLQQTQNKVPYIGDIPVAGNLFKSTSKTKSKSTLMVFIKPTILRDKAGAEAVSRQKLGYIRKQRLYRDRKQSSEVNELINEFIGDDY